jgi:hypothetical protein
VAVVVVVVAALSSVTFLAARLRGRTTPRASSCPILFVLSLSAAHLCLISLNHTASCLFS